MSWLSMLSLAFTIISALPGLIKAAEEAFGKSGTGPQKKQVVMDGAKLALDVSLAASGNKITSAQNEALMGTVDKAADTFVAAFNAAGVFKKSAEPAAP